MIKGTMRRHITLEDDNWITSCHNLPNESIDQYDNHPVFSSFRNKTDVIMNVYLIYCFVDISTHLRSSVVNYSRQKVDVELEYRFLTNVYEKKQQSSQTSHSGINEPKHHIYFSSNHGLEW